MSHNVAGLERAEGSLTHCEAPSSVSDTPLTTDRPYRDPDAVTTDASISPLAIGQASKSLTDTETVQTPAMRTPARVLRFPRSPRS